MLLLIDEAGTTGVPYLPEHASTVTGRRLSLWIVVQDLAQLEKIYGRTGARTLKNNCDSQIYYRPNDQETAEFIERCLGRRSEYARSKTSREGQETSQGQSETGVPVLSAWDIKQLKDQQIICFHRNLPPFTGKRMDWRRFPVLRQRQAIPPPPLPQLPDIDKQQETIWQTESRQERSFIDPDKAIRHITNPLPPGILSPRKTKLYN